MTGKRDLIPAYVRAVAREAEAYRGMSFRTLYIGGGTPSLLRPRGVVEVIAFLRSVCDLSDLVEISMEVNPESAGVSVLRQSFDMGVDRLSVGVQSLSNRELRMVGRAHRAAKALTAVSYAGIIGFHSISVDVIVGLPGQDWASLRHTLDELTKMDVDHVSLYCLSLEHDTPLAMDPPPDLPSDDQQADLFERAARFLEEREFRQYEISNFAQPGHECQHNLNYWRGGDYVGLGAGAASHLKGRRFKNRADVEAYIGNPTGLTEEVEELDPKKKAAEEAMLRLRLLQEGLPVGELSR
ncbi:MAG: radical SAM family heme chaperone HemW, partial [Chloroflexi bacterium]|nr:radical SAM family heme chaperone HemW [Chloroflexota bacterium]